MRPIGRGRTSSTRSPARPTSKRPNAQDSCVAIDGPGSPPQAEGAPSFAALPAVGPAPRLEWSDSVIGSCGMGAGATSRRRAGTRCDGDAPRQPAGPSEKEGKHEQVLPGLRRTAAVGIGHHPSCSGHVPHRGRSVGGPVHRHRPRHARRRVDRRRPRREWRRHGRGWRPCGRRARRGLLFTSAGLQAIDGLAGSDYTVAFGINDHGIVVGGSNTATAARAFLRTAAGASRELAPLAGDTASTAFGINNHNQAAGVSSGPTASGPSCGRRMARSAVLPGVSGAGSRARAINERGDVVGVSQTRQPVRALLCGRRRHRAGDRHPSRAVQRAKQLP